jgi:hypothetical protein
MRRYAALTGLMHGGTCNPARWAGLRHVAPLALGCGLKPHPWTELKNACRWRLCARFAVQVSVMDRLRASQRASLAKLDTLFAALQHRMFR